MIPPPVMQEEESALTTSRHCHAVLLPARQGEGQSLQSYLLALRRQPVVRLALGHLAVAAALAPELEQEYPERFPIHLLDAQSEGLLMARRLLFPFGLGSFLPLRLSLE